MRFDWDEHNEAHIAEHQITKEEAEQVFEDPHRCRHNAHSGDFSIIGMTEDSRLLTIIYSKREGKFRPFTGHDSTARERKSYNKRRRS